MTDNMVKKPFTEKESEILIKDVVTLVLMSYTLGNDGELVHINDAKAKTYQTVANVINDIEHGINDMSDLALVALTILLFTVLWIKGRSFSSAERIEVQFKDVNATAQKYIRPTYQIADCIINGMVDKEYIKVITDKIMYRLAEICC